MIPLSNGPGAQWCRKEAAKGLTNRWAPLPDLVRLVGMRAGLAGHAPTTTANAKVPARKDQGGNHLPAAFPPLPLLPVQNLSGRSMPQKVQKSRCTVELVTCKVA